MNRVTTGARWRLALNLVTLCTAGLACVGLQAAELRVAASGGFAAALKVLAPQYERRSGDTVILIWGPSMGDTPQALPNRLGRGEPIDAVIMVGDALDGLARSKQVVASTKTLLARSLIAMAVRSGASKPDISTTQALKKTLLAATSIAWSDSASGVYLQDTLVPQLGIADALRGKSRMIPAEPVGQVVARGDAEIGFQQLSELKPIPGIDIVGLIPEQVQRATLYSAAVVTRSPQQEAAKALIEFLASPAAAAAIRDSGLDPIVAPR